MLDIEATSRELWRPILRTAGAGSLNRVSGTLIRLATIPLLLRYLGAERYGLWMTIASTTAYIAMLDLGAGSAVVNGLTRRYQLRQGERASTLAVGTMLFLAGVALVVLVIGLLILRVLDLPRLLHLSDATAIAEVGPTAALTLAMACMQLPGAVILKIPYSMQRGHLSEWYLFLANLPTVGGLLLGVFLDLGLPFLAATLTFAPVLASLGVGCHLLLEGRVQAKLPDKRRFKAVLSVVRRTAPHFAIAQGAGTLMAALQFTLLALYKGAAAVAPYALMSQAVVAAQMPLTVLQQPLWTRLAELYYRRAVASIRRVVSQYLLVAALYSLCVGVALIFLVNPLLGVVMKHPLTIGTSLRVGFAVACAFGLLAGGNIGSVVLAMGLTGANAVIGVAQLTLEVVLAIILVPRYGAVGMLVSSLATWAIGVPSQFWLIRRGLAARATVAADAGVAPPTGW